jgi:hypothetical protein
MPEDRKETTDLHPVRPGQTRPRPQRPRINVKSNVSFSSWEEYIHGHFPRYGHSAGARERRRPRRWTEAQSLFNAIPSDTADIINGNDTISLVILSY